MPVTTFSSREFNQDVTKAKRAAKNGPVIITERGNPSHVLLAFTEYKKITNTQRNLVEIIAMTEDVDFEPPKMDLKIAMVEF